MKNPKECDLYYDGKCNKTNTICKCLPSTIDWFNDSFGQYDVNEVCRNDSIFGNRYFYITDADINALKSGKVLYYVDEYGIFIAYRADEVMKDGEDD